MAIFTAGMAATVASTLFKTKKRTTLIVVVALAGAFWTYSWWTGWTIDDLKEQLMIEEIENQSAQKANEDQQSAQRIDEAILTELLDNQRAIRKENEQIRQSMRSDVEALQSDWQKRQTQLRQRIEQADQRGDDDDKQKAKIELVDARSAHYDDVSQRVLGGMWGSYCGHAMEDDSRCTQ